MIKRPKVVFLAYYFPPVNAAASVRTWNMAKYLSRFGWDVTVVTPDPGVWRKTENLEKVDESLEKEGIHRILTGHRWRFLNPVFLRSRDHGVGRLAGGVCRIMSRRLRMEAQAGWDAEVEKACRRLTPGDVDVLLASGEPYGSFKSAKKLSERLGRPFVLDYRDLWTNGPIRRHRRGFARDEQRLLTLSAATTVISPSCADAIQARFSRTARPHVLTNGYDPEEMVNVVPYEFGHFAIVYAGIFYPPTRVVGPVMAALRALKRESGTAAGADWRFHYYGAWDEHVRGSARDFGVTDRLVLHGCVSRVEALSALRGAGVAVVITSVADEASTTHKGIVTAKVFDALGLGTPILLVSPHGSDVESIVQDTGCGRRFVGSDVAGMASYLANAIAGHVPRREPPNAYAWPTLVEKLDTILKRAVGRRPSRGK